ncbi:MAG: archaellin/type IV pilin N-terminal domain-containing protein [Thermoplasmata archaeon]
MERNLFHNGQAVSPVIATILMVAITVVLAATLYMMIPPPPENERLNPIQFTADKVSTGNWTLSVSVSGGLEPIDLVYTVLDRDDDPLDPKVQGAQFPTTSGEFDDNGVKWIDINNNEVLDGADKIKISSTNLNGFQYLDGYKFVMADGAQGEVKL